MLVFNLLRRFVWSLQGTDCVGRALAWPRPAVRRLGFHPPPHQPSPGGSAQGEARSRAGGGQPRHPVSDYQRQGQRQGQRSLGGVIGALEGFRQVSWRTFCRLHRTTIVQVSIIRRLCGCGEYNDPGLTPSPARGRLLGTQTQPPKVSPGSPGRRNAGAAMLLNKEAL